MGIRAKEGVDGRRDWSPPREPVRYFQRTVPIRGCRLSLEDVKAAYRDLGDINRKFGQEQVSGITPFPDETPDQYLKRMDFLLRATFCLTVTVCGGRDEEVHDSIASPNCKRNALGAHGLPCQPTQEADESPQAPKGNDRQSHCSR